MAAARLSNAASGRSPKEKVLDRCQILTTPDGYTFDA
jgi:hypothetical protein